MVRSKIRYVALANLFDFIACILLEFLILLISNNFQFLLELFRTGHVDLNMYDYVSVLICGFAVLIMFVVYCAVVPMINNGQTLGMYCFKVQLVKQNGKPLDFTSVFVKQILILWILPSLTFGLGFILNIAVAIYRKDHYSLSDCISKLCIVDKLDY